MAYLPISDGCEKVEMIITVKTAPDHSPRTKDNKINSPFITKQKQKNQ